MFAISKSSIKSLPNIDKLAVITLFFNFTIPKAGFYVGDFPLTIGYLLSGVYTIIKLFQYVHKNPKHNKYIVFFFLSLMLSTIVFVVFPLINYSEDLTSLVYFVVAYGVVPIVSYNTAVAVLKHKGIFEKIVIVSVAIVAIFGILQFVFINYLKINLSIPFVTVTGSDANIIFEKNIGRGNLYKAVSTYNNGNILGVNLLMLMPITLFLSRSFLFNASVRTIILMTLSRTVWVVWIFVEIIFALTSRKLNRLFVLIPILLVGVYLIVLFSSQISNDANRFIFDSTLGGRNKSLDFETSFAPSTYTPVAEIVYAAILQSYGIFGLLWFFATFAAPIALPSKTKTSLYVKVGMLGYLISMGIDGAFILIPTTFIYWSLATFVYMDYQNNKYVMKSKNLYCTPPAGREVL